MRTLLLVGALGLSLVACHGKPAPTTAPAEDTRSLFLRLGGQEAINAVVHEFVMTTGADPRISQFFMNVEKPKLEAAMDDHVCFITGGGCTYKGKTMLEAHTNMKVTKEAFEAFMDDLGKVLAKLEVGERETKEVIGAFRGMEADVVGH